MMNLRAFGWACAAVMIVAGAAGAVETPTSYGEAATVDTPLLRVPPASKAPTIDGVMGEGEWQDASSLSGFWYDYAQNDFRFMAPIETQLQVYTMYDKENLYFCFTSPVYPEASWLKAQGRFPDVLSHPQYGALWDDHTELEIRPYDKIDKGFQLGLLRWDVNPINTIVDWYWSQQGGQDLTWKSNAIVRSSVTDKRWVIEYAIPFKSMLTGNYTGKDQNGQPLVTIPPPDGTVYRTWLVRGIGGNGTFFNAFDNHCWNTTKTQLVFDSKAVSFQINELGPILEDVIDVRLTLKNHNTQSETVRLGFFVENAEGLVYSSYDSPDLKEGLLELRPGEVKELRLRKSLPGISTEGNVLWFDVRSAGTPAKTLFRTRLIRFHSMEGGAQGGQKQIVDPQTGESKLVDKSVSFRDRRIDSIKDLRPPKRDFDFTWSFSAYNKRLTATVDRGIHGASEEVKTAKEVKLAIMRKDGDETVIKEIKCPITTAFACLEANLPELVDGESYQISLLLFDQNMRIVGERNSDRISDGRNAAPFVYKVEPWMNNKIGLDDVCWDPYTPIQLAGGALDMLKHKITVSPVGLPAQIDIKADSRDLPLEKRKGAAISPADLLELGRGPQLRSAMEIRAVINGKPVVAQAASPAKITRQWKSEVEYTSTLKIGPLDGELVTRYDCDGTMHCRFVYGAASPASIERLELVMPVDGAVDLMLSDTGNGGMTGADVWECTLPNKEGVVWDSTQTHMELFRSRFVPWFWFGNGDRAFTYFCDSDRGFMLNKEGSAMQLERDKAGKVTWSVQFVNHAVQVSGQRTVEFSILTHPAKPKPKNYRNTMWHYYGGKSWAAGYAIEPYDLPEAYLKARIREATGAPKELSDEQAAAYRQEEGPYMRYGKWRNVQSNCCAEMDQTWEDKATYLFERQIRVGRRVGWWMDEYWPVGFGRSNNVATGNAYFRDANTIDSNEIPWQSGFLTRYMRNHYKRLARVSTINNVPQRQHTWSNNASTMLESCIWSSMLVEECGAQHRSFEVDQVTQFPNSLFRYMAHNWSGLLTCIAADATDAKAGDDKRLDRQHMGRALLNDIGLMPSGAHGIIHHREQASRLLSRLAGWGLFEDSGVEKLPFWRIEKYAAIGDKPASESQVYITVYRRPTPSGKGTQTLFVIMNESDKPVELPLKVLDAARVMGGPNTLKAATVQGNNKIPDALKEWWQTINKTDADATVLMDLETGDVVAKADPKAETYGPVFVPYHDFRVLTAVSE